MRRFAVHASVFTLLAMAWILGDHVRSGAAQGGSAGQASSLTAGISGQGKMRFRLLYSAGHLPGEAQAVLAGAHGGFAVDLRPQRGETYFGLKGAGIIQISSDLKSTRLLDTPA